MPIRHILLLLAIGLVSLSISSHAQAEQQLPLLLNEDFEHGMDRWTTTDPNPDKSVWKIESQGAGDKENHYLRVTGPSSYKPPHRSPFSIAWLKDVVVGDFELTARVQNTNPKAGPHRDLCFFWGYQDPAHFYYVHLGAKPDPHSCQIFIVNGADRKAITKQESKGTPWTDGWHKVKVTRNVKSGDMAVYFDNMDKPVMTANDKTFGAGQLGIGTFDDNGNFDNVKLRGKRIEPEKTEKSASGKISVEQSSSSAKVFLDGKLFAEYLTKSGHQPAVWPIIGPTEQPMTRSFPLGPPLDHENKDHPHHRSLWFSHGDVNGRDFWSEPSRNEAIQIKHRKFAGVSTKSSMVNGVQEAAASVTTVNDWIAEGEKICEDSRTITFGSDDDGSRWIDFTIILKATNGDVTFGDTKEGTFAVRVAGTLKVDEELGGKLINSEGQTNQGAWGQPALWIDDTGPVAGETVGLSMFSHPDNFRSPSRWHIRTYGLLAANPFAKRQFPSGEPQQGAYTISDGDSLKLRYFVWLHKGEKTPQEIQARYERFAQ